MYVNAEKKRLQTYISVYGSSHGGGVWMGSSAAHTMTVRLMQHAKEQDVGGQTSAAAYLLLLQPAAVLHAAMHGVALQLGVPLKHALNRPLHDLRHCSPPGPLLLPLCHSIRAAVVLHICCGCMYRIVNSAAGA